MLVPVDQQCNEQPNSTSPLPVAMVTADSAAAAALQAAVQNANQNSTAAWLRSPWDFRAFGLNLMKDVQRSNQNNPGASGVLSVLSSAGLLPASSTSSNGGTGSTVPVAFGQGYGKAGANRGRGGGARRGDRLFDFSRKSASFSGRGYRSDGGPAGDDGSGGTRDGRVCLPQPPAATMLPFNGPSTVPYQPSVSPNVPSPTIAPMPAQTVPAPPPCPKPSGNICLDLRNGLILASQVPVAVLAKCSALGYVGNCPGCQSSTGPVSVDMAALNALSIVDATSLGPCPAQGLGSYQGPYPIDCGAALTGPAAGGGAAGGALSGISPWWWVLLAAGGVFILGYGESPRATRRAARRKRAA